MSKAREELKLSECVEPLDVKLENSQSSSSIKSADVSWSTAPNTPVSKHKPVAGPNNSEASISSYEKAVLSSDALWEWNTSGNEARDQQLPVIPSKTEQQPLPAHLANQGMANSNPPPKSALAGEKGAPSNVGIVHQSDTKVQVGFFPTTTPLNTTNPAELPGSRKTVITAPPGSKTGGERSRAKSIEEASSHLEKYAPEMTKNPIQGDGLIDSGACLGLTSYLSSSGPESITDSGRGSSLAKKSPRKVSIAASTTSIQGSSADLNSLEDKGISEDAYAELTKSGVCYDFIPTSTKIVVFDTRLRVKKAFFALVANGIRAAPLWDSAQQKFVGMLTITDFINILRHHYKSPIAGMDELENQTIQEWRDFEKKVVNIQFSLIQIGPEQSLYEGIKMLVEHKIHRLPVINPVTGNALYILTHKRILEILMQKIPEEAQPQYMFKSLEELGLGTYENIATASPDTPIITALNIFHEKRVSALPIVDSQNKVVDIYAKFDVINLAAERTYTNLDVNLRDALQHRSTGFEGVHTCLLHESLYTIVQRLISTKVHRLVVVDGEHHPVGVVSLSDILKFLVMTPHSSVTE